jgi:hypothetical protein
MGNLSKHVIAVVSKLHFLELAACSKNLLRQAISSCLNLATGCLHHALEILRWNPARAEDVSISEVLGRQITNWQLRQHNFGSSVNNFLQLVVNDLPFSVHNLLEVFWVLKSDFSTVLLGLQLELKVKSQNLRVDEALWLLLKSSVRERLLEADTLDQE